MPVAPPFPRLPSLNALRAFEAAARLGGFAQAAQELQVTPGAISAQVKLLEDDLGAPLFERSARGVRLTSLGARALPGFIAAFDGMSEAMRHLRQEATPGRVHIATLPALAQLWLAPRLPGLRAALPDMEISITALETPPNLKRVPFDLCLFYANHNGATPLCDDHILPVCTPELAHHLHHPRDLATATCLTDATWAGDWEIWAERALPDHAFTPRGPVFSLYALAVQEALAGAGVLIARRALVAPHLDSGALVAPFATSAPAPAPIAAWSLPGSISSPTAIALDRALRRSAAEPTKST
ncbi:transcriptional regulator, LysR family [Thalassovita litoralis]|jgi:LysR family glycine cleavage system transcriptional activator|uniref:Transcriptional regulator, LysR family n=1 Tax=Thalassovita litoralis TaxID=1010611 RepID=A0A521BJY9_9RHOB|nr:LysR family transcriptional regulator [Thalassovita litoralis]SMO47409.1 transcriptional regulator, LysR family [Thalassovita litoralis]